jgi:hypothetical protein
VKALLIALGMTFAGTSAALVAVAPGAGATYGPHAEYQIALSNNCNGPNCAPGGGGEWGWAVLNNDSTGDLITTDCGHLPGFGGGAENEHVDIYHWHDDTNDHVFFMDSASDTSFEGPTPIPDMPGHYNIRVAPGIVTQIQVTKIPNR